MKEWMGRVFLSLVLAAVAVVGTYWYKDRLERIEKSRQALQTISQETEEKERLASLGDISMDLSELTLGMLNGVLQQPMPRLDSRGNSTRVSWACGGRLCALVAGFAIPAGKKLPLSVKPIQLTISDSGFEKPFGLNRRNLGTRQIRYRLFVANMDLKQSRQTIGLFRTEMGKSPRQAIVG
jgi:hypothetical protein